MNKTIRDLKDRYKLLEYKQLGVANEISRAKKHKVNELKAEQDEILTEMLVIKHLIESLQVKEIKAKIEIIQKERVKVLENINNCECEITKNIRSRTLDVIDSDLNSLEEDLEKARFGIL